MKVKLKEIEEVQYLSIDKEYEVLIIFHFNSGKDKYGIEQFSMNYFIINDNYRLAEYFSSEFIIVDSSIEEDYIYSPIDIIDWHKPISEHNTSSYMLHPRNIDTYFLRQALEMTEPIEMTAEFGERFKHLLSTEVYEKVCKEYFQDPNVKLIAEKIEDNWVFCPSCYEAFEVLTKQGVLTCPNDTHCRELLNNPFARKFEVLSF